MLEILYSKALKDTPDKIKQLTYGNLFFKMCSSKAFVKNIFLLPYTNSSLKENQVRRGGAAKCGHTMEKCSSFLPI